MLLISLAFKKSLQNLALFTISLAEEKLNWQGGLRKILEGQQRVSRVLWYFWKRLIDFAYLITSKDLYTQ